MRLSAFLVLLLSGIQASADSLSYSKDLAWDDGTYGEFPHRTYVTTNIISPRPNYLTTSRECDDSLYTLVTPRGYSIPNPGPMLLDSEGLLAWHISGYRQTYNLMVQEWRGEKFLTFWGGDDGVRGHGSGHYFMVSGFVPSGL